MVLLDEHELAASGMRFGPATMPLVYGVSSLRSALDRLAYTPDDFLIGHTDQTPWGLSAAAERL